MNKILFTMLTGIIVLFASCQQKELEAQTIECDWNVHDGYEFVADTPCEARLHIRNHLDNSIMIEMLNTDGDNWDSESIIGTLWVFGVGDDPEFGLLAYCKGSRMYISGVPNFIKSRIIELDESGKLVMQFTNDLMAESIYLYHKSNE